MKGAIFLNPIFFHYHGPDIGFGHKYCIGKTENSQLHMHDYYEIFLTLSDEVIHCINGAKQLLKKNSLVFVRPTDVHMYYATNKEDYYLVNLAFTNEIMKQLRTYLADSFPFEQYLTAQYPVVIVLRDQDAEWIQIKLNKINLIDQTHYEERSLQYRMLLFLIFTKYMSANSFSVHSSGIPLWLSTAYAEMKRLENFSAGTQKMVELTGKSRGHVSRCLQKYYHVSLSEYVNSLRLNYMANLLINSNINTIEICYECGFQNISWAYSLFKEKFGVSPYAYRKSQQINKS